MFSSLREWITWLFKKINTNEWISLHNRREVYYSFAQTEITHVQLDNIHRMPTLWPLRRRSTRIINSAPEYAPEVDKHTSFERARERCSIAGPQAHTEPYGSERKLRPRIIYRGVSPVIIMIIVMRQACLLCILLLPARPAWNEPIAENNLAQS